MNAQILTAILILVIAAVALGISFFTLSKEKRKQAVKEWLKYAVVEAEKSLGSKTGQLKLHKVYNMATSQFPWLAQLFPFEVFSEWVDEALLWMKEQLETNQAAKDYVESK